MKGIVYIMTDENNSVLYTGVTSDLKDRIKSIKLKNIPEALLQGIISVN